MLGCTGVDAVVVANCVTRQDKCIRVAEFFSGGFAGWSRAVYVLHSNHMPIRMCWTIDSDTDCSEMLRYHHRAWVEATNLEELGPASAAEQFHNCADINTNWWIRALSTSPVDIACISAPCQPWSAAGSEHGLASMDGQLMLRMADILGVFKVPLWC